MSLLSKLKWSFTGNPGKIAMVNEAVEGLQLPKGIVPLQKSVPPYMPVEGGHGFLGVLLYNIETDEVQCHICGEWHKQVGNHLSAHKISSHEYKDKFGLYRNQPLNGLKSRENYHKIAIKRNKRLKKNLTAEGRMKGNKKINDFQKTRRGAKSIQHQNLFGTCEAQLRNRVKRHIQENGFFPRSTSTTDPYLATMLWRRFGSLDAAKKYYQYE